MKVQDIIERFGAIPDAYAEIGPALGVSPKAVELMVRRDRVPYRHHLPLLRLARERGVSLSEEELLSTTTRSREREAAAIT
jgi:hypothetical protein